MYYIPVFEIFGVYLKMVHCRVVYFKCHASLVFRSISITGCVCIWDTACVCVCVCVAKLWVRERERIEVKLKGHHFCILIGLWDYWLGQKWRHKKSGKNRSSKEGSFEAETNIKVGGDSPRVLPHLYERLVAKKNLEVSLDIRGVTFL